MASIARRNKGAVAGLAIACMLAATGVVTHPQGMANMGLNPQPLPPRFEHGPYNVQMGLNPQPLPPRFATEA